MPDAFRKSHDAAAQGPDWEQPAKGYRFSRDSVLLAGFCPSDADGPVADLGAGCGVVGLEALAKGRLKGATALFLVERDQALVPYLERNALLAARRLPGVPRIIPMLADWGKLSRKDFGGSLSHVCCNPPYVPQGKGRPAKGPSDAARRELHGGLSSLLTAAASLLAPGGTLSLSLPSARMAELAALALDGGWDMDLVSYPERLGSPLALIRLGRHQGP
ncbi:MAG: hypothetical protein LBF40_09185 [Deltaproteobacteria bacterium]|jgi:tRNA1Val (adenine37-N6)-methyltransferase|nr:hypothetical protein [Deltaproteobacteria bacterium]